MFQGSVLVVTSPLLIDIDINVGNPIINLPSREGKFYSLYHPMVGIPPNGDDSGMTHCFTNVTPWCVIFFSSPTGPPKNTRPFERLVDWRRIAVFLRNDEVGGAETYMVAYWYYMVKECYRML